MEGILLWLAAGAGALFFVAAVVAWWEHLGRKIAPPESPSYTLPPPTAVDLDLDLPPAGDVPQRQAALGQALERMTQPGELSAPQKRWSDTTPMIGPGPAIAPAPVAMATAGTARPARAGQAQPAPTSDAPR